MKSRAAAPRHRHRHIVLVACLAVASMPRQAVSGELVGAPLGMSALVHEGLHPRFSLDSVFADVTLGTLEPGDTESDIYQLSAEGTTHGGKQWYSGFAGNPCCLDVNSGNLVLRAPSVPEPATWLLRVIGLSSIIAVFGGRRSAPMS
jgi:hypothetical protein